MRARKLSDGDKRNEVARMSRMMSRQTMETVVVVASWFLLNIAMASTTKWLFLFGEICTTDDVAQAAVASSVLVGASAQKERCVAFKFPLSITIIHMVFSWVMCYVHIFIFRGGLKGGLMGFRQQSEKIAPLAACFALSVAMGNLSLKYIYPSFNQMLGAMSPLITVLMAVVFQQKRYNAWTWGSMPVICGGLVLCSAKEVNYDHMGAFFATGATVLRAAKSIMQGKLLIDSNKLDSVTLLFYMAPWAAALLFILATFSEGVDPLRLLLLNGGNVTGVSNVLFLLVVSGLNACLLNVSNFLVTSYTSAVTLQVLGNVKSCLSIGISVLIFRNDMSWEQSLGVAVCLFGVWLYNKYGATAKAPKTVFAETPSVPQACGTSAGGCSSGGSSEGTDDGGSEHIAPVPTMGSPSHKSAVADV